MLTQRHSIFLLISLFLLITFANANQDITQREDVQAFINKMVTKHKLPKQWVTETLSKATIQPDILAAIQKPYEALPWYKYRPIFLSEERAKAGAEFWQQHQAELLKAEQTYGVPANIIVAIIGVESYYGKFRGKHKVLDALTTLGFDYPPRAKFFSKELEEFLQIVYQEQQDPEQMMGSYAGAMGQPQFMPSSFRAYAVDFSGTGKRDLQDDIADIIGSVANYFKQHGWRSNEPIVVPAKVPTPVASKLAGKNLKPTFKITELEQQGIKPGVKIKPTEKATVIKLDNPEDAEYWLGLNNFYVITRYNHSPLYAMAVYQLSEEISKFKNTQARSETVGA